MRRFLSDIDTGLRGGRGGSLASVKASLPRRHDAKVHRRLAAWLSKTSADTADVNKSHKSVCMLT